MFIASPEQFTEEQVAARAIAGAAATTAEICVEWENPLPSELAVGAGTTLYVGGWCWQAGQVIQQATVSVNGRAVSTMTQQVTQHDLPANAAQRPAELAQPVLRFWALVDVPPQTTALTIHLRGTLTSGKPFENLLAQPRLTAQRSFAANWRPEFPAPRPARFAPTAPATAKVAICMATYNPDPAMFRRQIESIRAQTHPHWLCVISDDGSDAERVWQMLEILGADERFAFYPYAERLNFYHNFERALALAPADAAFIALADQDDYWFPQKLATLREKLAPEAELAYSDLRLATPQGEVLCDTYWTLRRNNFKRLGPLLLMNTVPGASALFRRSLLAGLLPFPPRTGHIFHDQWLSIIALARGPLSYVDAPLYDYTQHPSNVVGYAEQARRPWRTVLRYCYTQLATPSGRQDARQVYFAHLPRIALLARVAWQRSRQRASFNKRRLLQRGAQLDHAWRSLLWLFVQGLRDWRQVGLTNGTEFYLLAALCWRQRLWVQRWLGKQ